MEITKDRVVSMHYTLTNPAGEVLDTSKGHNPLVWLQGHGNLIGGLEARLEGATPPANLTITVPAAEAYGLRDPKRIVPATRSQFPADVDLKPGLQFQTDGPEGPMIVTVSQVSGDTITLDANHPLAGVDLTFAVELLDIRAATADEVAHGHIHSNGSCGH